MSPATVRTSTAGFSARNSAAVAARASAPRAVMTTLTPSRTSAIAQPLPSPLLAAHTSAHLPVMSQVHFMSSTWPTTRPRTSTSTVPATTQPVNGSPSSHTPSNTVLSGPTMPACADSVAPMRSTAIMTISTGAKVHSVAFSERQPQHRLGHRIPPRARAARTAARCTARRPRWWPRRSGATRPGAAPPGRCRRGTRHRAAALPNTSAAPRATWLPWKRSSWPKTTATPA